jgi:hypothetical protein
VVASRNAKPPAGPLEASGQIATGPDLQVLLATLGSSPVDPRLVLFRERFPEAVEAFVGALALEMRGGGSLAALARP